MQPKIKWQDLDDSMVVEGSYIITVKEVDEEMVEQQKNSPKEIKQTFQDCSASETIYSKKTKYVFSFYFTIGFIFYSIFKVSTFYCILITYKSFIANFQFSFPPFFV